VTVQTDQFLDFGDKLVVSEQSLIAGMVFIYR